MKLVQDLAEEYGVDNPWSLYRAVYKGVDCGPTIGFQVAGLPSDHPSRTAYAARKKQSGPMWFYCDDLRQLGTFDDMTANGLTIVGVSVSSIVEGSDQSVDGGTLHDDATQEDFYKLVEAVDAEASFLWERDNSSWYCLKSPEDEPWSFHETWGDIKWDCDEDDLPEPAIVAAVEKFIEDGGNMTWEESWGRQTHKYDVFFPLPGAAGWTVCEYMNDASWW